MRKASSPLHGKSVLITRPRRQSGELAGALRRHGARVIVAPAIRIRDPVSWKPLDRALRNLGAYDTIIFTSANGVDQFFKRAARFPAEPSAGKRGKRPHLGSAPARRLFAIGPATAKALGRHGWRGVGGPDTHEGAAFANHVAGRGICARHRGQGSTTSSRGAGRNKSLSGRRILIPRARVARDVLPRILKRRGARVDVVEVYRTVADSLGRRRIRDVARRRAADIVTFTSSSTVEQFMKAAGSARTARRFFDHCVAASIGPVASRALRRCGVRRIVEARPFTTRGLVDAILRWARVPRRSRPRASGARTS
ncbi:MAG: uroporphyrinogen-III synthase [Elusimicrobia bacterium]|nr:uroporphyrinogen-III synthase [Elusimicrobiota bacterium]